MDDMVAVYMSGQLRCVMSDCGVFVRQSGLSDTLVDVLRRRGWWLLREIRGQTPDKRARVSKRASELKWLQEMGGP